MPNYNHARFLPRCLGALLAQSVQPREIIVIDDASTDDSVAVIRKFAERHPHVRLVQNPENRGVVFGMNRGVELAQADYLYYSAADDEVLPGMFERSLRLLAQHPQAAMSCGIGDWREEDTGVHWQVGVGMAATPSYLSPSRLIELECAGKLFIDSRTAIWKLADLRRIGGFDAELRWHCDWFALHALAFRHGVCFVPEAQAVAHILRSSFHSAGRSGPEHQRVLESILDRLARAENRDLTEALRACGGLYLFGTPMRRLLRARPQDRHFLNATFLRKNRWHSAKLAVKRWLPGFAANWYFRLAGYRAKPRPAS